MRIVVVGSVGAGTSVGAWARRTTEDAEIVVHEREFRAHPAARGGVR